MKNIFKKQHHKHDRFIDEEIKCIEETIRSEPHSYEELKQLYALRAQLIHDRDDHRSRKHVNIPWDAIAKFTAVGASVATTVLVLKKYEDIALLSYGLDEQMKLANGHVMSQANNVLKELPKT